MNCHTNLSVDESEIVIFVVKKIEAKTCLSASKIMVFYPTHLDGKDVTLLSFSTCIPSPFCCVVFFSGSLASYKLVPGEIRSRLK